jgi:hypothetical protein
MMPYMAAKDGLRVGMQTTKTTCGQNCGLSCRTLLCGLLCVRAPALRATQGVVRDLYAGDEEEGDASARTDDAQPAKNEPQSGNERAGTFRKTGKRRITQPNSTDAGPQAANGTTASSSLPPTHTSFRHNGDCDRHRQGKVCDCADK